MGKEQKEKRVKKTEQGEHSQMENRGDREQQEKREAFPTAQASKLMQKIWVLPKDIHAHFPLCSCASVLRGKTEGRAEGRKEKPSCLESDPGMLLPEQEGIFATEQKTAKDNLSFLGLTTTDCK